MTLDCWRLQLLGALLDFCSEELREGKLLGNLTPSPYLGRAEVWRLRAEKKVELDENPAVTAEKLD